MEVRGLAKQYGAFTLENVSFDVPAGSVMGFIGQNGAGKTTTIKMILGVIKNDSGVVTVFGKERGGAQNEHIGVVMDAPLYVDDWTAADVERGVSPFYPAWNPSRFAAYLQQFGLDTKKKVKELSRGMKIKLQMAVALSHNAKLLILDEPTSGLDPVARDEICDLLSGFVNDENSGVLFSTHITSDLEKIADYITFIQNGGIVFTGSKDAFLEKYVRVAGGLHTLDSEQKKLVIGLREYGAGFEGMVETANLGKLPREVLSEQITLDEIIVFMNKGGNYNE